MRILARTAAVAAAAALAAACQTDTRSVGSDPADAAARGGWTVSGGGGAREGGGAGDGPGEDAPHGALFDPPERDPSDVVSVPVAAYDPIDRFFDNEGYLLGDRIEIDCSFEPFMARLIGLAYADESGKFVVRDENREGDVHTVRLRNVASGVRHQANYLPRATFGSQRGIGRDDPETGKLESVNLRPFFEIVATEEIVIRFHMVTGRETPVFFRAVARGTPGALEPGTVKDCVYLNANRRRRVLGPELSLDLAIRRDGAGKWAGVVRDPGSER